MDFAGRLAALMTERGLGVRAVARRVPCDPALISRLRSGAQPASQRVAKRLDSVLQADGELAALAAAASPWQNGSLTDDDHLRRAAQRPGLLDSLAVDSLAGVLAAQRELEDRIGSQPMLAPVAAQVRAAETMVRDAPEALRDKMLGVTAQFRYFEGWLHENTGRLPSATARYDRALGQATEAGDPSLVSELLSMKGHLAWAGGDAAEAVRLSRAAQRDRAAFPGQHAISAMQEARGLAVLGDARQAAARMTAADSALARAEAHDAGRPPWLYYHSPGFFDVQRGRVWLHLAEHDPRYNSKAVAGLTEGVGALDPVARQSEWGTMYLLHLARAHMQAGDAEQACAVAADAAESARHLGSGMLMTRLRRLQARMVAKWGALPCVAALGEALR